MGEAVWPRAVSAEVLEGRHNRDLGKRRGEEFRNAPETGVQRVALSLRSFLVFLWGRTHRGGKCLYFPNKNEDKHIKCES